MPTDLATTSRIVLEVGLEPVNGTMFQPTGFPNLGAATYDLPGGGSALLVESVQSMANHLEAVGWDAARRQPADELARLPWVRVVSPDGEHLTSSREEPHRLAGAYVRDGAHDGQKGTEWLVGRLGLEKDRPLDWRAIYAAIWELDPLCLLHGVFFSEKGIHGNPKVRRAITAVVEATDVKPVVSGGLKRDDVSFTATKGKDAEGGYGFVPFDRTEYVAGAITLKIVIDAAQITGYGLGSEREALLLDIALWEVARLLEQPLRLRTMCDLDVTEVSPKRPEGFTLPTSAELAERIAASSAAFETNEPWVVVYGAK